jgi:hypothetical protein
MRKDKVIFNKLLICLTLTLISGCSCQNDKLTSVCPTTAQLSKPCLEDDGGSWVEVDSDKLGWNTGSNSTCRIGFTTCNNITTEVSCSGFSAKRAELCGDNMDNDCDGKVDEGFDLDEDEYKTCEGDCDDTNSLVNPTSVEVCNNIDDNCDWVIDEIYLRCWTGPESALVDTEDTLCKTGYKTCHTGNFTECKEQVLPRTELCNGVDDNCDSIIDNYIITDGKVCGPSTSIGQCDYGREQCVGGESYCIDPQMPQNEECNSVDDDCDGYTDEDLSRICTTVCGQGIEFCSWGSWIGCTAYKPDDEICDGMDNDCDDEVDEGCLCTSGQIQECYNNIVDELGLPIACGIGIQFCDENGVWGECNFYNTEEESCNNWDDDCDGTIDDLYISCGDSNIGECKLGKSHCEEGMWSLCEGEIPPQEEVCDNLDNNCDGEIDEDLDPNAKVDMVFAIDISASMCDEIDSIRNGVANYVSEFANSEHLFGLVVFPTIGINDDDISLVTLPPLTNVNTFLTVLDSLNCEGGGIEPSFNTLFQITDPADPLGIGWRDDAKPYVILVTDEPGQSIFLSGINESAIATNTTNCQIGNCESGDRIEVFVFTYTAYFSNWDSATYFEPERLIEIFPANSERYVGILRNIFENVCLYSVTNVDSGNDDIMDSGEP